MLEMVIETITTYKEYSIPGLLLLVLVIISINSRDFYIGIKKILLPAVLIWLACVAFHYVKGFSLYSYIGQSTKGEYKSEKKEGAFEKYYKLEGVDEVK